MVRSAVSSRVRRVRVEPYKDPSTGSQAGLGGIPLITVTDTDGKCRSQDAEQYTVIKADIMTLNLRGTIFKVNTKRVGYSADSVLYRLSKIWGATGNHGNWEELYVDRNPGILHCILDYNVSGELHLPDGVCGEYIRRELMFWGVGTDCVSPCCLGKLLEGVSRANRLAEILRGWKLQERLLSTTAGLGARIYGYYFKPFSSPMGIAMYVSMAVVYLAFLAFLMVESIPSFRVEIHPPANGSTIHETYSDYIYSTTSEYCISQGEKILLTLLTVWLFIFFILCPNRRVFWVNWPSIVAAACLLIQWFPVTVSVLHGSGRLDDWSMSAVSRIYWLKVTRIAPLVHMLGKFRSIQVMYLTLVRSKNELLLLLVMIILTAGTFGYLVYILEIPEPSTDFRSIPDGFWWGLVTLTSVGYGDLCPQGVLGKVVGACCAVVGILVVALPVPIIAGNFTAITEEVETVDHHLSLKMAKTADGRKRRNTVGQLIDLPRQAFIITNQ